MGSGGTEEGDIFVGKMAQGLKQGREHDVIGRGPGDVTENNGHLLPVHGPILKADG